MHARDLAETAPAVNIDDPVAGALKLVAAGATGVVVTASDGTVVAVLPASQVLRLTLPGYLSGQPRLARTWDESHADRFATTAQARTVRAALPSPIPVATTVAPEDTLVEVALAMSDGRTPLVVVVELGRPLGVITVQRLLASLLPT